MNRLVVVSNRVPVPSANEQAGGLAVALNGLMARRGGLWFGWSGQVAEGGAAEAPRREVADGVTYATVDLTREQHDRYYNNFSNAVLWPLLHTLPELMRFDREDARVYRETNEHLADTLRPMLRANDVLWIHDYHLMPMAAALRARGVRNPIGFFLHIPFASPDVLAAAPEVASLVRDLLAADLIGFQTENDLNNFAAAAILLAGAARLPENGLQVGGRRVRLGVFPVEIEARAFAATAAEMARAESTEQLRASLAGVPLIVGIDRLDPTKGLPQRLAGYRRLLEKHERWRRNAAFLQIAAVSRKEVEAYRDLQAAIDLAAGSLNAELGDPDWQPLRFVRHGVPREVCAGYMRAARVGFVTPLRDGMNLVAKEFVAAQDPQNPGVLVLSQFAGAARQLDAALLVNPHDTDAMADALDQALDMSLAERKARWKALWGAIEDRSPVGWGRGFVAALMRAAAVAPALERAIVSVATTGNGAREMRQPVGSATERLVAGKLVGRVGLLDGVPNELDPRRFPPGPATAILRNHLN